MADTRALVTARNNHIESLANMKAAQQRNWGDPRMVRKLQGHIMIISRQLKAVDKQLRGDNQYVELRPDFTFKWFRADATVQRRRGNEKTKYNHFSFAVVARNTPDGIAAAEREAKRSVVLRISKYAAEHPGGVTSTIYDAITNPGERYELVNDGENPWHAFETTQKPAVAVSADDLQYLTVNAMNAPAISGHESFKHEIYGCATETIWQIIQRHPKMKKQGREVIFRSLMSQEVLDLQDAIMGPLTEDQVQMEADAGAMMPLNEADDFVLGYTNISDIIGMSVRQVVDWFVRHAAYFSFTGRFPQRRNNPIRVPTTDIHNNYVAVDMLFNNGHLYVRSKKDKESRVGVEMIHIQVDLDEDYEPALGALQLLDPYIVCHGDHQVRGPSVKRDLFVDGIGMDDIVAYMIDQHKMMPDIETDQLQTTRITLRSAAGRTRISPTSDYEKRKELFEKLHVALPLQEEFNPRNWNDQTWTRITTDLHNTMMGEIPTSFDSQRDREFVNRYYQRAMTQGFAKMDLEGGPVNCDDLSKCYSNEMKSGRGVKIPLPTALDTWGLPDIKGLLHECDVEEEHCCDGQDLPSELIVGPFKHWALQMPTMIWSSHHVKDLLRMRLITVKDILMERRCTRYMTLDSLAEFAEFLEKHYGEYKAMYTSFCGGLGKRHNTSYECELTTDKNLAGILSYLGDYYRDIGEGTRLMFHKKSEEEYLENTNTLFRWIVGAGNLRLFELMSIIKHTHPKAVFLSVKVDAVYYQLPTGTPQEVAKKLPRISKQAAEALGFGESRLVSQEDDAPLPYKREYKLNLVKPRGEPRTEEECMERQQEPRNQSPFDVRSPEIFKHNKIVHGCAGCGKSRLLKIESTGKRVLNLAVTRGVRNDMKVHTRGVAEEVHSETFARLQVIIDSGKVPRCLLAVDHINIDEFSMMSHKHVETLNQFVWMRTQVKTAGAGATHLCKGREDGQELNGEGETIPFTMSMFGDPNQIPPVKSRQYDFLSNPSITWMFPNQQYMEFVPRKWTGTEWEGGRYNQELYDASQYLLKHQKLSEALLDRVVTWEEALANGNDHNVCYTNNMVAHIIAERLARGVNPDRYRIIANSTKYDNGTVLTMAQIIEKEIPKEHYVHDVACTTHAIQGRTLEAPLTIWESEHVYFALSNMYVAITRNHDLESITIVAPPSCKTREEARAFMAAKVWKKRSGQGSKQKFTKMRQGKVYLIEDQQWDFEGEDMEEFSEAHLETDWFHAGKSSSLYVGQTARTLEERFAEHQAVVSASGFKFSMGATIREIARINDQDQKLLNLEKSLIKKHALGTLVPCNEFHGWESLNKYHNPLIKKKPTVVAPVEELAEEVVEEVEEVAKHPLWVAFDERLNAVGCPPIRRTEKGFAWELERKKKNAAGVMVRDFREQAQQAWNGQESTFEAKFEIIKKKVEKFVEKRVDAGF